MGLLARLFGRAGAAPTPPQPAQERPSTEALYHAANNAEGRLDARAEELMAGQMAEREFDLSRVRVILVGPARMKEINPKGGEWCTGHYQGDFAIYAVGGIIPATGELYIGRGVGHAVEHFIRQTFNAGRRPDKTDTLLVGVK
jgi:hypothetical protein